MPNYRRLRRRGGGVTSTTNQSIPKRKDATMCEKRLTDQTLKRLQARRERLEALWIMTPTQRVTAMRRGELSLEQCAAWAARYPEQMPQINGEFEYLAAFTPEVRD